MESRGRHGAADAFMAAATCAALTLGGGVWLAGLLWRR
jgi:hypothetical protein